MDEQLGPIWISIGQACDRWGCRKTKLYELLNARNIHAVKLGARTLVNARRGDDFFASLPPLGQPTRR